MYWNRSPEEIAGQWQAEIETRLEAGSHPLFDAGLSQLTLAGMATLLGVHALVAHRQDMAAPTLAVGGNSALWAGTMLRPRPTPQTGRSESVMEVVYAGADPATHLGTMMLLSGPKQTNAISGPVATPLDLQRLFAPRLQPGAQTPWSSLPFVEAGERPRLPLSARRVPVDWSANGIAWGAMLLALTLIVLAIFV